MSTRRTSESDTSGAVPGGWRSDLARARHLARRAAGFGLASETSLLLMLKTAGAAAVAWVVAVRLTATPSPVLAPLAAVLVLQSTVYQTMQDGLRRVGGVVLGVLLALALGRWLGLHAWSLIVMLLLALLVGRMFRLGSQTNQVAVSALLVVVIGGTTTGYAQERIFETLLGAAVGVLVNVLIAPPVHVHVVRDSLAAMASRLAGLLVGIGQRLSDEEVVFASGKVRKLLFTAQDFHHGIADIRDQLDHASESLRFNPRHNVFVSPVRKPAPAPLLERVRAGTDAVDLIVDETGGIARALVDVAEGRVGAEWASAVAGQVGKLVISTGRAVQTWSQALVSDNPQVPERPGAEPLGSRLVRDIEHARVELTALSQELARHRHDTETTMATSWLVLGGVLADISRILIEIDPVGGAYRTAVSATPPARLHLRRPTFRQLRRRLRSARRRLGA